MGKAIPNTAARRSEISSYLGSNVRQLLVLSHSTVLVETANIFINNLNFNWPAGLHLWSNSKSTTTTTLTTTSTTTRSTTTTSWTIPIYALVYWIVGPSILRPLLEEHDDRVQQPI